jgi:hypothetical protein
MSYQMEPFSKTEDISNAPKLDAPEGIDYTLLDKPSGYNMNRG